MNADFEPVEGQAWYETANIGYSEIRQIMEEASGPKLGVFGDFDMGPCLNGSGSDEPGKNEPILAEDVKFATTFFTFASYEEYEWWELNHRSNN